MKIIGWPSLDQLSSEAAAAERLRRNLNLHDNYADLCQRLFNAVEPDSYIRPHRHVEPPKTEFFMAVRGRMMLILFDNAGRVEQAIAFGSGCDVLAMELPAGLWHTLVSLEPGSIFFEVKPGPYAPMTDKDFAPWAPAEDSPLAAGYLAELTAQCLKSGRS